MIVWADSRNNTRPRPVSRTGCRSTISHPGSWRPASVWPGSALFASKGGRASSSRTPYWPPDWRPWIRPSTDFAIAIDSPRTTHPSLDWTASSPAWTACRAPATVFDPIDCAPRRRFGRTRPVGCSRLWATDCCCSVRSGCCCGRRAPCRRAEHRATSRTLVGRTANGNTRWAYWMIWKLIWKLIFLDCKETYLSIDFLAGRLVQITVYTNSFPTPVK